MEICLCLAAGVVLVWLNRLMHGVPMLYGGSVLIGCGSLGFFISLDMDHHSLRWVRAGHGPVVVYDPVRKEFSELSGEGIAMGIDENYRTFLTNEPVGIQERSLQSVPTVSVKPAMQMVIFLERPG
jgi:hypothetical protein